MIRSCSRTRGPPASGSTRREAAFQSTLAAPDPSFSSSRQSSANVSWTLDGTACHAFQPSNQEPPQPRFNHLGFMRIRLERVTTTKKGNYGFLVFVRHEARKSWLKDAEEGMVINITGDTLYCLCKLLRDEPTARPMPLDLLSDFITRGHGSCEEWGLIRVAITGLKQETYVAKAYFGNKATGEVKSELDMRPSDATYLSHMYKTPIYVDMAVWNDTSITHDQMTEYERKHGWPFDCGNGEEPPPPSAGVLHGSPAGQGIESRSVVAPLECSEDSAGILDDDPELIKMMKKKMAVAISEENYGQAAQLRDSPLMSLYRQIRHAKQTGDSTRASQLQRDLDHSSASWDFS